MRSSDNWLHNVPVQPQGRTIKKGTESFPEISAAHARPAKGEKAKATGVQSGVARLRLRDISAAESGRSSGQAGASAAQAFIRWEWSRARSIWRGRRRTGRRKSDSQLDVAPAQKSAAGELPITAHMQGTYRAESDSLELAQFNLATSASKIQAAGILARIVDPAPFGSHFQSGRVAAAGNCVRRAQQICHSESMAAPHSTASRAEHFPRPRSAARWLRHDFEFTLPATSRTPEQPVHWDSLAANIQLSAHDLAFHGGTLRRGDTSADFDVDALLQNGEFSDDTPISAHVNLHNVDVASTAALAAFDYPVSGRADLSLQIVGTRAHPQVQGHIHATNASAYGEAIQNFDADLQLAGSETALNNIHLTHDDADISGTAAYTPMTRGFRLDLVGRNFDLSHIRQIHLDPLPVEGRADFTLKGSGTLDAPDLNATVHATGLTFDHELSGTMDLEATTKGGELLLSGHSDFQRGSVAS